MHFPSIYQTSNTYTNTEDFDNKQVSRTHFLQYFIFNSFKKYINQNMLLENEADVMDMRIFSQILLIGNP